MSNSAIYNQLRKGPKTEAQLLKATKLPTQDFDDTLEVWRRRMWLTETGDKLELSEQGRIDMENRYPE